MATNFGSSGACPTICHPVSRKYISLSHFIQERYLEHSAGASRRIYGLRITEYGLLTSDCEGRRSASDDSSNGSAWRQDLGVVGV